MYLNSLRLIGRLAGDAAIVRGAGTPALRFHAVTKDLCESGPAPEGTNGVQHHSVVAYGAAFEPLAARLTKRTRVYVEGRIATRRYTETIAIEDGAKVIHSEVERLAVEVVARTVRILDGDIFDSEEPAESAEASADKIPEAIPLPS